MTVYSPSRKSYWACSHTLRDLLRLPCVVGCLGCQWNVKQLWKVFVFPCQSRLPCLSHALGGDTFMSGTNASKNVFSIVFFFTESQRQIQKRIQSKLTYFAMHWFCVFLFFFNHWNKKVDWAQIPFSATPCSIFIHFNRSVELSNIVLSVKWYESGKTLQCGEIGYT